MLKPSGGKGAEESADIEQQALAEGQPVGMEVVTAEEVNEIAAAQADLQLADEEAGEIAGKDGF